MWNRCWNSLPNQDSPKPKGKLAESFARTLLVYGHTGVLENATPFPNAPLLCSFLCLAVKLGRRTYQRLANQIGMKHVAMMYGGIRQG